MVLENHNSKIVNNKYPSPSPRHSSLTPHPSCLLLPPIPSYYIPPSYRLERPIIFCPFSILIIEINAQQTLITIYKTITYVSIIIFTNVKNVRQINLFMQNKPKVNMDKKGKIKPVLSGVEWTNSRFCVGRNFNDNSL
jgi:hypothetical protein